MSRRRYISTVISVDRRLQQVSDSAALLYTWMIPHAEDAALLTGNVDELANIVVPNRKGWNTHKVASALEEMVSVGLLTIWKDTIYFPIQSFYRYQSSIPVAKRRTEHPNIDVPANDTFQNLILETAQNAASPSPSPSPSKHMSNKLDEFDTFWKLYPRKIGKEKARGAWAKALRLTNAATIIAGLGRLLSSLVANEPQFIPHPATWLNGGRWTDEADTEATPRGAAYVPFSPERQAQDLADRERIATGRAVP